MVARCESKTTAINPISKTDGAGEAAGEAAADGWASGSEASWSSGS